MSDLIFKLEDVYYSYLNKFDALCGINLEIKKGAKVSIIGANGTGKSTLLQVLDGLIFPNKGKVFAFDEPLTEKKLEEEGFSKSFRNKVGFVFQSSDVQLFCPTVREDIVFGPLNMGVEAGELRKRFDEVSNLLGLQELFDRSSHQLSVGEKRKVAIASILIGKPEVIILDEPTAGLDPQTSRHIIDTLTELNLQGTTIITATHDLHIVEEISDIVHVFSKDKKIVRSGPAQEILTDNLFLEEHNLVHIHRHRHKDEFHIHKHVHLDHHSEDVH